MMQLTNGVTLHVNLMSKADVTTERLTKASEQSRKARMPTKIGSKDAQVIVLPLHISNMIYIQKHESQYSFTFWGSRFG